MNKKFLSAILFGALMVTSTGTFVSCKDYDDDIDEINATLNDLKSQLAALQSKVESGNYVTGVSKTADGILFTFSNGSTSPIAIKDGEKGEAGKDGSIVTVVDGVLYIDGKATDIKAPADAPVTEFRPAVKVDDNGEWAVLQADGTYKTTGIPASPVTVKGDDATGYELTVHNADGTTQVVKLPTANSVLDSAAPSVGGTTKFEAANGSPIVWGVASAKNDSWAGPLGKIAKDQLLIGQSAPATITVKPVSYDLSAQTLKLVDNQGNVAPVVVTATPSAEEWITESAVSRAVSKTGKWNLHIQMASSVTKDNIASAFKAKVGTENKNKMYALTINGKAVTDYTYVIDVAGTGATTGVTYSENSVQINGKAIGTDAYELGKTHTVSYENANVADAYLSLSEAEKVKAEVMGVVVKGMTVTAPKTAANGTLEVTLNLLGTNGTTATGAISMKFGTSTVDAETTLPATTYTLNVANKPIDINLGNVFSGLSAAEFTQLSTTFSLDEVANQKNFLLSSLSGVTYHKAKNDGSIDDAVTVGAAVDAKVIKYLRLPVNNNVATDAKAGSYTLKLTLKDKDGNEMKKITIPVTVALPSFGDLYAKSASGNWNGNAFTAKLLKDKKVNLSNAFNAKDNNSFDKVTVAVAKVDDKQMVANGAAALNTNGELTLTDDIINKEALRTATLAAEASYTFYNVKDLTVSTTFTIDLHSQFEAPKLVYYVNNEAKNVATVGANNEIATLSKNDKGVKNGLAILYGRGEDAFETGKTIDGVTLSKDTADDNKVVVKSSIKDVANATAAMEAGKVIVSENKGTLVATFTDVNGIVTTATIAFE